jgi:copper(I)-binding protein
MISPSTVRALVGAVLLCLSAAGVGLAEEGGTASAGAIEISAAWVRGTPPGAPVSAGYLAVTNTGQTPDRLVGGSAPFADRVEIHEMEMHGGVMRMAEIEGGLVIAPGETAVLRPGGNHVMFMDLTDPPQPGDTVTVTLEFAKAGPVTVEMPVSALGAQSLGGD